ncbi:MAG: Hsp33 family molecular chaperone HslO [Alphaproteobacteria bacterium]|nr:Hsp33 family molecular chaperone HslO [Alphaproteobacteria bacterium]
MANKNFDECTSFLIDNGVFVGRICRLDNVLKTIINKHGYMKNVSAALAETTALGVLLANALKFEGLFTLQLQGNGPVSAIVVDVTSNGKIRACANYDRERLEKAFALRKNDGQIEATPHLLGTGTLVFTLDDGKSDYHQGIVELQGKTLEECALRYFRKSEQIETMLKLFIEIPDSDDGQWKAGGIVLQRVPELGGKDVDIKDLPELRNEAEILMNSLTKEELFDENLSLNEILYRLYHANNVAVTKVNTYEFACRCSREKLLKTLRGFSEEELSSMVNDEAKITAKCGFCSEEYEFTIPEIVQKLN